MAKLFNSSNMEMELLKALWASILSLHCPSNTTVIPLVGDVQSNVRSVKIIRRVGAASDHPIGIHCPETEYFKSTWMVIE